MLWLAYFMGLAIFYALINWMPILFKEAGLPAQTATLIAALFPLGGRVLPDAGPRHRRRVDAADRPLRRHRRLVPRGGAGAAPAAVRPGVHGRGRGGPRVDGGPALRAQVDLH